LPMPLFQPRPCHPLQCLRQLSGGRPNHPP
jgi:hypothetical protein